MAEPKTRPTDQSVEDYIASVENAVRREDSLTLLKLLEQITGLTACMWGSSIVGFGSYHYRYASGREGDWPKIGFSARKSSLSIYIMDGFSQHQDLLDKLGKYKNAVSCLYIKRLADVDIRVLTKLLKNSYNAHAAGEYDATSRT